MTTLQAFIMAPFVIIGAVVLTAVADIAIAFVRDMLDGEEPKSEAGSEEP